MKDMLRHMVEEAQAITQTPPSFSKPAARLWAKVPDPMKTRLLNNVWCSQCRHSVTILCYSGRVMGRDLLLSGLCCDCSGKVSRVIEMS